MIIDYYAHQSRLYPQSSGFKLIVGLLPLVLCIGLPSVALGIVLVGTMGGITLGIGGTPWRVYRQMLGLPLVFLLMGCLTLLVQIGRVPGALVELSWISVTEESLWAAIHLFFRAFGGMSCLYFLVLSTPSDELVELLERLRVPGLVTQLMLLTYRFVFLLLELQKGMVTASQARLGNNGFLASVKTYGGIMVYLFILAVRRGSAVYDGMVARGYESQLRFYSIPKKSDPKVWRWMVVYFGLLLWVALTARLKGWR